MPNLGSIVRELKTQRDRAQRELEQLNAALMALGSLGNLNARSKPARDAKKRKTMSGCPQENRGGSARTLGEVEGRTAKEVTEIGPHFPQFHSQIFVFLPRIALTAIKQLFSLAGVDG
jgi:hypothetical protein